MTILNISLESYYWSNCDIKTVLEKCGKWIFLMGITDFELIDKRLLNFFLYCQHAKCNPESGVGPLLFLTEPATIS